MPSASQKAYTILTCTWYYCHNRRFKISNNHWTLSSSPRLYFQQLRSTDERHSSFPVMNLVHLYGQLHANTWTSLLLINHEGRVLKVLPFDRFVNFERSNLNPASDHGRYVSLGIYKYYGSSVTMGSYLVPYVCLPLRDQN